MSTLLWVGFGFVGLVVMFLMVAFFFQKNLTADQRTTLRFLTALCAGFAGGLITGEALFELSTNADPLSMTVSGGAGFALFFTVWFTYESAIPGGQTVLPDGFNFSVPAGWTFAQAVTGLASGHNLVATLDGFSDDQSNAPLREQQITAQSIEQAMQALGELAAPDALPSYAVSQTDSTHVRVTAEEA